MSAALKYVTQSHNEPLDVNVIEVLFQDYGLQEMGKKQDSREFMFNFINLHFPDLRALIQLEYTQYLTCTVCQNVSSRNDMDIMLSMPTHCQSVQQFMDLFFGQDLVEDFHCSCKSVCNQVARRIGNKFPKILMIHNINGHGVTINEDINLLVVKYFLLGFIKVYGRRDNTRHYTCVRRHQGQWCEFDDEKIKKVVLPPKKKVPCYILLYCSYVEWSDPRSDQAVFPEDQTTSGFVGGFQKFLSTRKDEPPKITEMDRAAARSQNVGGFEHMRQVFSQMQVNPTENKSLRPVSSTVSKPQEDEEMFDSTLKQLEGTSENQPYVASSEKPPLEAAEPTEQLETHENPTQIPTFTADSSRLSKDTDYGEMIDSSLNLPDVNYPHVALVGTSGKTPEPGEEIDELENILEKQVSEYDKVLQAKLDAKDQEIQQTLDKNDNVVERPLNLTKHDQIRDDTVTSEISNVQEEPLNLQKKQSDESVQKTKDLVLVEIEDLGPEDDEDLSKDKQQPEVVTEDKVSDEQNKATKSSETSSSDYNVYVSYEDNEGKKIIHILDQHGNLTRFIDKKREKSDKSVPPKKRHYPPEQVEREIKPSIVSTFVHMDSALRDISGIKEKLSKKALLSKQKEKEQKKQSKQKTPTKRKENPSREDEPVKKRGRPRKIQSDEQAIPTKPKGKRRIDSSDEEEDTPMKKKKNRGRPRKRIIESSSDEEDRDEEERPMKRKRGRPRKDTTDKSEITISKRKIVGKSSGQNTGKSKKVNVLELRKIRKAKQQKERKKCSRDYNFRPFVTKPNASAIHKSQVIGDPRSRLPRSQTLANGQVNLQCQLCDLKHFVAKDIEELTTHFDSKHRRRVIKLGGGNYLLCKCDEVKPRDEQWLRNGHHHCHECWHPLEKTIDVVKHLVNVHNYNRVDIKIRDLREESDDSQED